MLHGVATQTQHAGPRRLTITSTHAKQSAIQAVLTHLAEFLRILKATAEQLTDAQRLRAILTRAFAKFMGVSHRHLRGSALKRAQSERATAVFRIIDRGRQQVGGLAITLTEGAQARSL